MAKGFSGMGMPGNMNNLMKQAQKMQRQMEEMQAELESKTFESSSGGGAVKVVVTGKKAIQSIEISRDVIDPDDAEMLQDLIMTAINDAISKAEEAVSRDMGKLTGGLNLPF